MTIDEIDALLPDAPWSRLTPLDLAEYVAADLGFLVFRRRYQAMRAEVRRREYAAREGAR